MNRTTTRTALLSLLVLAGTACAQATGGTGTFDRDVRRAGGGPDVDCLLRVENAYDIAIEAGARAGDEEVELGSIDAHDALQINVPCSLRVVTVYRVLETAPANHLVALGSRARALDPDRITTVTLRPASSRTLRRGG